MRLNASLAHSNVFELPKPVVVAPIPPMPADLIDLPELGAGDEPDELPSASLMSAAESIEVIDLPAVSLVDVSSDADIYSLDERRTGMPSAEPVAPILKLVTEPPRMESPEPTPELPQSELPPSEPEEITIGGVSLSFSLWKILVDEAKQHLATLENDLSVLQFDPRAVPSAEMIRASHTLCGIHRTGGFPLVAESALALEQTLARFGRARCAVAVQRAAGARPCRRRTDAVRAQGRGCAKHSLQAISRKLR